MADSDLPPFQSIEVARAQEQPDAELAQTTERVRGESARPNPELVAGRSEHLPRIDRYLLLQTLGEGGMGVVYAAYDEELERKVAVKLIHPSRQGDSQLRARIQREAQALARVSAPNVVHVYQCAEAEGRLYIAMEFVNGTTLTKWQVEPGRTWQEIVAMYSAAGRGLQAAHEAGLVHRDFKPERVIFRRRCDEYRSRGASLCCGMESPRYAVTRRRRRRNVSDNISAAALMASTPGVSCVPPRRQEQPST